MFSQVSLILFGRGDISGPQFLPGHWSRVPSGGGLLEGMGRVYLRERVGCT